MNTTTTTATNAGAVVVVVPESLLLDFFQHATKELASYRCDDAAALAATEHLDSITASGTASHSDIRRALLSKQRECLTRVVEEYNKYNNSNSNNHNSNLQITAEQVQDALQTVVPNVEQLHVAAEEMNEMARLAFGQAVLYTEWNRNAINTRGGTRKLEASKPLQRSDLLAFCGLMLSVLKLPNLQRYLENATPLYPQSSPSSSPTKSNEDKKCIVPHERLEQVQRMLFRAVGYDPDHGMSAIKRIFFTPATTAAQRPNEYAQDTVVMNLFQQMLRSMQVAVADATRVASMNPAALLYSDEQDGGVTRIVAVQYSERIIDPHTGLDIVPVAADNKSNGSAPPVRESMAQQRNDGDTDTTAQQQQREQLRIAARAAALQQELLGELLHMDPDERNEVLLQAQRASEEFTATAMTFPPGPQRILYMQSLDASQQRLVAMHKVWESVLAQPGGDGKSGPTMRK